MFAEWSQWFHGKCLWLSLILCQYPSLVPRVLSPGLPQTLLPRRRNENQVLYLPEENWVMTKVVLCLVSQSCLTLCDPVDYSPPGFSIHGIFQARILEWVAISYSRGSSWPRDQNCLLHWQAYSLPLKHWVSPKLHIQFSSVQFSCSVVSDSLWPWGPKLYTKLEFPVFWGNVAF